MTTKYEMWLTHDGEKEWVRLPVLPEVINIAQGMRNQSVNIAELGEITILQNKSARTYSFTSFFPSAKFPGMQYAPVIPPLIIKDVLRAWQISGIPVHFIMTGYKINMFCSIENFNWWEKGGDVGTLYYTLSLKEYTEVSVRKVTVSAKSQIAAVDNKPARVDNTQTPKTYTVKKGDCLWNIAKAQLGNASRYTEIAKLNADIIKNSNFIYAGQVLKLPV